MSKPENSGNDHKQLLARITALETLQQVARDLTAELDHDALLQKILRAAITVSGSTAGSLFLYDRSTHELVFKVIVGGGGDALKEQRIPAEKGIAGQCFTRQRAIIVDNAEQDPRYFSAPAVSVGMVIRQLVAVPLVAQGKAIGVLEVMNKVTGEAYSQDDADLLMAFAGQSAVALENARLYGQVLEERDRILAVEAAVRHELARDLHDGPANMLSVLIMQLRYLRDVAQRDPGKLMTEFVNLEAVAQKAMYQTRNILFDLRPVILEQRGLGPALEQYVMRLRMVEPFRITLDAATLKTRLDTKIESAIFSIVQEAVNNTKKHAGAKNLEITADEEGNTLTITVRDDGRGFDVATVESRYEERGSLGLLNMKERAEIAHGRFELTSTINGGTTVRLVVPL
ncbi:MAG: GAF domain-containing sensor histidine kinase [Anaerolineae bacterium]|nr:GAF domain-containing sensor histidine kinase [Anaerolineae bacterium]